MNGAVEIEPEARGAWWRRLLESFSFFGDAFADVAGLGGGEVTDEGSGCSHDQWLYRNLLRAILKLNGGSWSDKLWPGPMADNHRRRHRPKVHNP